MGFATFDADACGSAVIATSSNPTKYFRMEHWPRLPNINTSPPYINLYDVFVEMNQYGQTQCVKSEHPEEKPTVRDLFLCLG